MPSTQTPTTAPAVDRAIALVMAHITALPGHTDDDTVHVHITDQPAMTFPYLATVVYERTAWLDYDVLDTVATVLEAADLDIIPERLSSYEIAFLPA